MYPYWEGVQHIELVTGPPVRISSMRDCAFLVDKVVMLFLTGVPILHLSVPVPLLSGAFVFVTSMEDCLRCRFCCVSKADDLAAPSTEHV